jgi:Ca-activated chloride channel family protein
MEQVIVRGLVILGLLGGSSFAFQQTLQTPTFRSRVEAVRVDVLVTDGDHVVKGLTAKDFVVLDNNVKQSVEVMSFERVPLNVVLALDVSFSVTPDQLDHLKAAVRAIFSGLQSGDKAGVLTFSDEIRLPIAMQPKLQLPDLNRVLGMVSTTGSTALIDATYAAMAASDIGDGSRPMAVVFSDGGEDTASFLMADEALAAARRSETVVYAIQTGKGGRFISQLCDLTGGRLFGLQNTQDLASVVARVLAEFRERYILSFTPQTMADASWHELRVQVPARKVTVRARRGYFSVR